MGTNLTPERMLQNPVQLVPLTFMQDAVAADQSAVALAVAEVASGAANGVTGYAMPWAGTIVGISAVLSAAATAGALAVAPTVGGSAAADPALAITDEASLTDTALRDAAAFDAGDIIGVDITTNSAWNGTSSDLAVTVWALMEISGV